MKSKYNLVSLPISINIKRCKMKNFKTFPYLFSLFAAIALLTFVGCQKEESKSPAPTPEVKEFVFENIVVTNTKLSVDVIPENKNMEYVVFLAEKRHFLDNGLTTSEAVVADDLAFVTSLANGYNMSKREFLTKINWLSKGDKLGYTAINLYPSTEYIVYCYGINLDNDGYVATTKINYLQIKTAAPLMQDVKFEVTEGVDGTNVSLNINPNDYDGLYYSYIVPDTDNYFIHEGMEVTEEYVAYYRKRAYDEFNALINDQGIAAEEFCHRGSVTIDKSLAPYSNYQLVLFAVSQDQVPILCSLPTAYNFSTTSFSVIDFTIDIEVTDITPYNAQLSITASNNKDSYACVFVSREQAPNSEDEYAQMLQIMEYLDPPILQGSYSEQLGPLTPDTEYTVLAFGVEDNLPTTHLVRYDFTSSAAAECKVKIEGINMVKLFDAEEIVALDRSYADDLAECQCVAIVEMQTSVPTDKIYMWWYEEWMTIEYNDEAFLEDMLLNIEEFGYSPNPEFVTMYYSMSEDDKFLFAGMAMDEDGIITPIYYTDTFLLSKEQCDPAEEFFEYVNARKSNVAILCR